MKLTTFGLIAAALFATALSPITSASNRSQVDSHDRGERMESRHHGQNQGANRHGRNHADRGQRRHDAGRRHGQRHANRYNRHHLGHRSYSGVYSYNRHSIHRGHYRRHHSQGRHGYTRISFGYHLHGNPVPAIAGGIIGGAIAHKVSGGDQGATFLGAVLGAAIVSDADKRRHHR